jgi:hypothetical protein
VFLKAALFQDARFPSGDEPVTIGGEDLDVKKVCSLMAVSEVLSIESRASPKGK